MLRGRDRCLHMMLAKGHSKDTWTVDSWEPWQRGHIESISRILWQRNSFMGKESQANFHKKSLRHSLIFKAHNLDQSFLERGPDGVKLACWSIK